MIKTPIEQITNVQTIELLKELHILTRDGKINQDSRRKLKQIYHLTQFIEPLLEELKQTEKPFSLVDHGAGKSYLGFLIYDFYLKNLEQSHIFGIETRSELVDKSINLQKKLKFDRMSFFNLSVQDSIQCKEIPAEVDLVTALHACDTATDDAIEFALQKKAKHIVLVPCCQAEVASVLKKNKASQLKSPFVELWRHPLHTREFGSHLTNILRCLRLEAHGYQVTVTEFVGLEHSMKNELIIGSLRSGAHRRTASERVQFYLSEFGLEELTERFKV